jgi:RNA polymerase sigma factor (TIGR02999 family)
MRSDEDITGMLARARAGDAGARDGAVAALYRELSRMARSKLSAESTLTNLDATALVHECYIRLAQGAPGQWENRRAFFAYAGTAMRNVIVDVARERNASKRGGGLREVTLTTGVAGEVFAPDEIEHLEAALAALGKVDAQLLAIVEMRYFAGLTVEDVAQQLEISPRTVKRRWESARAFLYKKLRK